MPQHKDDKSKSQPRSNAIKKSPKTRKNRIRNKMLQHYSKEERTYYQRLSKNNQNKIAQTENTIIDVNEFLIPTRFKILTSALPERVKAIAMQKLDHLYTLDVSNGEYHTTLHWIESIIKIPFEQYMQLPINATATASVTSRINQRYSPYEIKIFLDKIKTTMNSRVYGHLKAKDQIIRLLAQWISNPESKGLVIGIHGKMGTGKTSLIKDAICNVLEVPFAFIPLGGVSDSSYLLGHSPTYQSSVWGKIVDVLMTAKCMNPVLFFDELDKVSTTRNGDDIINTLIHLTDSTQNDKFHDKYFSNIEFDLSRCLVIFSYNNEESINPILLDRMVKITTEGYLPIDKIKIARHHLIPELFRDFAFKAGAIEFTDDILKSIIRAVEDEEGVRNFKRGLHDIISNYNLKRLMNVNDMTATTAASASDVVTAVTAATAATDTIFITEDDVKKYVQVKTENINHLSMYT